MTRVTQFLLFTQVASLFKAKDGQVETSSAQSAPPASGQPLSYAEFVVQSKNRALQGAAHGQTIRARSDAAGQSSVYTAGSGSVSTSSTASGKPEAEQQGPEKVPTEDQTKEESQSSESCIIPPHLFGSGNSIIVSPRQRGNPILKFVRNVPWEFGEIVPDYVLGRTTCALFLRNPNIYKGNLEASPIMYINMEPKDPHHALKELARICIMADCTLILAWSPEEAGRYLETYKSYEKKPADVLKEQVEKNYRSQVRAQKPINKSKIIMFGSFHCTDSLEGIIKASKEELVLCPGLGPQKVCRDTLLCFEQLILQWGKFDPLLIL
uniref:Excision repair cross-complementation group 1 n=1 Tax=Sinocyclocheilus rhinocerous TaxID=307959 RepID=A0A673MQT8_9TELE